MTRLSSAACRFLIVALATFAILWTPSLVKAGCPVPRCGNGVVEDGEGCDDGNLVNGDGCAADCTESFDLQSGPALFTYPAGYPRDLAAADLNNDGTLDLLVTTYYAARLYSYIVQPDGAIVPKGDYALGSNTIKIDTGNLNGDHFVDVVTIDANTDELHIFFGNGDGTLTLANIFNPGERPFGVTVGDINTDGFNDVVVGCLNSHGFRIYYGDGQGGFPTNQFISTGGSAFNSEVYDFNGDGYNDLVVGADVAAGLPSIFIYRGSETGLVLNQTFNLIYNGIPTAMDQNGDGHVDLYSHFHALTNLGDGSFTLNRTVNVTKFGSHFDTGDLNNDGFKDVAVCTRSYPEVRVLVADRAGWFQPERSYPMPDQTDGAVILDLNGDALPDVLGSVFDNSSHREVVPVYNHNYYQFPRCGDGRIGRGETCDDGNKTDGDGCSATCQLELPADRDHDGLTDNEETVVYGTDPASPDSDLDCVLDGAEVCAGQDPRNPGDQAGCIQIASPAGDWHVLVTLLSAPPDLDCDLYLTSPRSEPLIKHSLKNVGKIAQTPVKDGDPIAFNLHVDASGLGLGEYDHGSESMFGRVTMIDAYKFKVGFETLPANLADWNYQDLEILVELIPKRPAVGIHVSSLDEFRATADGTAQSVALPFDGFASAGVSAADLDGEASIMLTAGLPELYADLHSKGFASIGKYVKLALSNGQTALLNGGVAQVAIAYDDDNNDGIVDGTGVPEGSLLAARWDEDGQAWVELAAQLDGAANLVTASTDQIGVLTLGHRVKPLVRGSGTISCAVVPGADPSSLQFLLILVPALAGRLYLKRKPKA